MDDGTRRRRPQEGANFKDRTGQRFGKLVVVRRAEDKPLPYPRKNGRARGPEVQWLCTCDCGNERTVPVSLLRSGGVKSCGCSRRDPRPTYRLRNFAPGQAARNDLLAGYRAGARERGLQWALTDEQFDDLTSQDCIYCGCAPGTVKFGLGRSSGDFIYNGIDRIDNALGYVEGNVAPCCSTCNHAKKDMPYDDFIAWIVRLSRFQERLETLWAENAALQTQIAILRAHRHALEFHLRDYRMKGFRQEDALFDLPRAS